MTKTTKTETNKKPKTTCEFLRFFRMRSTLNQLEAAKLLGKSNNYVSNTETGERLGSAKYLATFAKIFKLSTDEKAALLESVLVSNSLKAK